MDSGQTVTLEFLHAWIDAEQAICEDRYQHIIGNEEYSDWRVSLNYWVGRKEMLHELRKRLRIYVRTTGRIEIRETLEK